MKFIFIQPIENKIENDYNWIKRNKISNKVTRDIGESRIKNFL
ncbi:hypothetical protein H477_3592 [[Clostridium] sordellii ATCC 9714]|nr:hypothetical protein [Paeniclostridium sordellii]EPZ54453.1 hypothetical protein H477_3592 [[Clostridium] sordellii ATCC 9714] [Paeniclostridium sordellii ATCC 9714]